MPDGMIDPAVIAEITKEVRGLGDNHKVLKESLERDLAAVRAVVEEAGKNVGPEVQSQVAKLTESVLSKQTALETSVSAFDKRFSTIEANINRRGMGAGHDDKNEAAEREDIRAFARMAASRRGQLKPGIEVEDKDIDFDGIRAWNKAFPTYLRHKDERAVEHRALEVGSDPDGGYWVPNAVSNRIVSFIYETSPMRQVSTVETISTDALEIPNDLFQFGYGWVGEQESRPETTTSQTGVIRIPVHEMYAEPKATQKLLEDAAIDVVAWLTRKVADRFSRVEASAFVNGSGVKMPRGFMTYPNVTTTDPMVPQPGKIQQVISGSATGLTTDGLINLMVSLKEPYAPGAVFMMQRATVGSIMTLKDGDGQYIWRAGLDGGKPSVLLGSPVLQAADMPSVGAGALPVAYANFREGYTIVDRLGITTLRDPFTAKPFVLFYSRRRVGGDVTNFDAIKLQMVSAS